ncbi:hypothetical protein OKJ48_33990 [Streptomyces kunmingensis]|uniref:AAA+ ATPase domain-containing protein n=1 Tax=Streptomyces kunmingensis TaxID=68225 RepID=A0ABU6CKE0_9ACTN|nr:hypothetical protein [Streptomyces kunmingensis]MEB3965200.1 hypothetical protein [Streptomyces kunmingensis]
MEWTVEFEADCGIDEEEWGGIRSALSNVPSEGGVGHWPGELRTVSVVRRLAGGRSGSQVLELRLELAGAQDSRQQVAKLSPLQEAAEEWRRGRAMDPEREYSTLVPVVAASRQVLDPPPDQGGWPRQVVVYQHAQEREGAGPRGLRTLEDIVRAGVLSADATEQSCHTLRKTLARLAVHLHRNAQARDAKLAGSNRSLGVDVHLRYERVRPDDVAVELSVGSPDAEELRRTEHDGESLRRASTAPPGPARTLAPGQRIAFRVDRPVLTPKVLEGTVDHVASVRVVGHGAGVNRDLARELADLASVRLSAEVVQTRSALWSQRLVGFLDLSQGDETAEHLRHQGLTVDHPLRSLHGILAASRRKRVFSVLHGDLNPRNILLVDSHAYVIDFANALKQDDENALTFSDYTWLEVCLLRELEDAGLSWEQLVGVQRKLAVLCTLAEHQVALDCLDKLVASLAHQAQESDRGARLLLVLWEVRRAAMQLAAGKDAERPARQLLEHLTLSALRALKFPDREQSAHRVRSCAAVAGVAGEGLREDHPTLFSTWDDEQLALLRAALLTPHTQHHPHVIDLLIAAQGAQEGETAGFDPLLLQAIVEGPARAELADLRRKCSFTFAYIPLTGRYLEVGEPLIPQGDGALDPTPREALDLLTGRRRHLVLVGECGSGKTTVVSELRARLLSGDLHTRDENGAGGPSTPWPLLVKALSLRQQLHTGTGPAGEEFTPSAVAECLRACGSIPAEMSDAVLTCLLQAGGILLIVDEFHQIDADDRPRVLAWIKQVSLRCPSLRIVLCQRGLDYQPDALGWQAVALHKVRAAQASDYIEDHIRRQNPIGWRPRVRVLYEAIFQDAGAVSLRDLATKPLFLHMMVKHYLDEDDFRTTNPGRLVEEFVRRLVHSDEEGEIDRRMRFLRRLAYEMDEHGAALPYERALSLLNKFNLHDPERTLDALLHSEAIVHDPNKAWVTFANPIIHAYCVAAMLQKKQPDDVCDRILHFHCRDAAQLLVANPDTDQRIVSQVLETALDVNIVYGTWLLQAAPPNCFAPLRERVLQTLRDTLGDPGTAAPVRRQTIYALAKNGTPQAKEILESAALDGPAAADALDGLVMMHQWFVPEAAEALNRVLTVVFDRPPSEGDDEVTVRALRSVAAVGLTGLAGHVWDRVTPDGPWAVVAQAWQTLRQLDIVPSRTLSTVYADACAERLAQLARQLRGSSHTETERAAVLQLHRERMDLLTALAAHGRVDTLLEHRFGAGFADAPGWDRLLETAAEHCTAPDEQGARAALLLADAQDNDWPALLAGAGDLDAAVAAHRMLQQGEMPARGDWQDLASAASPRRLLTLASFVHGLHRHELAAVDDVVRIHAPALADGYLEALSALVGAVSSLDTQARPRAALMVDEELRKGAAPHALAWPWALAWRRSAPDHTESALFLDSPGLSTGEKRKLISTTDVLIDAPYFEPVPLSATHSAALQGLKPRSTVTGIDAHRFVLIAASTGLHQQSDYVRQVAFHPDNEHHVIRHAHPLHGAVDTVVAAHALVALAYLTRLEVTEQPDAATKAYSLQYQLKEVTYGAGAHESLHRARLIALGILGDWNTLMEQLDAEEPLLLHAVLNIVMHWLPGPCTPGGPKPRPGVVTEPEAIAAVAAWINDRLRQPGIEAPARAALTHLRDSVETKLGRYVR